MHRIDGHAVEHASGIKEWYFNDKLHREDGPAIEFPNGTKYWYIYGIPIEKIKHFFIFYIEERGTYDRIC